MALCSVLQDVLQLEDDPVGWVNEWTGRRGETLGRGATGGTLRRKERGTRVQASERKRGPPVANQKNLSNLSNLKESQDAGPGGESAPGLVVPPPKRASTAIPRIPTHTTLQPS